MAGSSILILRAAQIPADTLPDGSPGDPYFDYDADFTAANYATVTTTGGVLDTSGNARPNAIPSTSATRATLNADGAGGHSYLSLDGVDDRFTTTNGADASMLAFGNAKTGLSVATVVEVDPTVIAGVTRYVAFFAVGTGNSTRFSLYADATGNWGMASRRLDADATVNLVTTTPVDDRRHLLLGVVDYSTATQRLYLDGVLIDSQPAGTPGVSSATNGNAWSWGSNASPAGWIKANMYRLRGYDRALSDADAVQLFDAWSDSYALSATPPGVDLDLTADGTSTSDGSADIDIRTPLPLAADGSATSTGSAAIGIGKSLAAAGLATSTGSAAISVGKSLSASGSAASTGSAAITATRPLAASGLAGSSGSATIAVTRPVAATGTATSTGSAAITRSQALAATGVATSAGSAAVSRQITLSASATTLSEGSAQTVGDTPLSGFGTSATSGSAAIVVRRPVSAGGTATSSGSAAIGAARPVTASGSAASSGSAVLRVRYALVADGTSLTVGDVEVGLALTLTAEGSSDTTGAASITLGGLPQRQPGTITLHAVPLGVAALVLHPHAVASLIVPPAATAILVARPAGTATLTTED